MVAQAGTALPVARRVESMRGQVAQLQELLPGWEEQERELHRNDIADLYIATAERYQHSAIFIHPNPGTVEETIRLVDLIREKTGDRYFLTRHGDATFSLPDGNKMVDFSYRIADDRLG